MNKKDTPLHHCITTMRNALRAAWEYAETEPQHSEDEDFTTLEQLVRGALAEAAKVQDIDQLEAARNAKLRGGPRPAPDFEGFLAALREEIAWSHQLHPGPLAGGGQAQSDRDSLARLAQTVELIGRRQGFLGTAPRTSRA